MKLAFETNVFEPVLLNQFYFLVVVCEMLTCVGTCLDLPNHLDTSKAYCVYFWYHNLEIRCLSVLHFYCTVISHVLAQIVLQFDLAVILLATPQRHIV